MTLNGVIVVTVFCIIVPNSADLMWANYVKVAAYECINERHPLSKAII